MKSLYHVTPAFNVPSITDFGLSSEFSRGRTPELWWCEEKSLKWALIHVSRKYKTSTEDLAIYKINVPHDEIKDYIAHGKGLFHCSGIWHEYSLMSLETCMKLVFGEGV